MKIRNILFVNTTAILFAGCFATTSANLEKQNFMNKFTIKKDYKSAAKYTYEMFQICRTNNLLTYKNDIYENVGKAEVTANGKITIFGGTNYWTKINLQKDNLGNTKVTIYSYMNSDSTRRTAKLVEEWLVNNSKECDSLAFY
jgi:hypothetical protein